MYNALEMAGDVSSAGTALAGLLLVFMGSIATSFEGYQKTERRAVLTRFRYRIWFAFAGFSLSVLAAVLALLSKAFSWPCAAMIALFMLIIGFGWALAAAIRAAMDVR